MSSKAPLVSSTVHVGVVDAAAVLVDPRLAGLPEARRRVLELWAPGTRVYRVGPEWLVRFGATRRLRCAHAPGLPLVLSGGALVALPLEGPALARVSPPAGSLVVFRGGRLSLEALTEADREDPAAWLDVRSFEVVDVAPLGSPPARPRLLVPEAPPFDPRERLPGVPPAAAEREEVLRTLREPRSAPAAHRTGSGIGSLAGAAWARLRTLGRALARGFAGTSGEAAAGSRPARPPSFLRRLVERMHDAFSRLAVFGALGRVLGRRQAEYVYRTIEMLERGDIHEALRHAIPLGGPEGARLRIPLSVPAPRTSLAIRPGVSPAGATLGLALDLYSHLQGLYRAAFARLEAQGRIDEAAFVLAELLHANEEAVAFLERHGRLRLAAEMAEARDLPPGLVVRLWFLVGDRARAVEIARRRGAFADAVLRLERSRRDEEAAALRLLWADALASAGDYGTAVSVVWTLPSARPLATAWIDRAIEQGGPSGAAMLVRKLVLAPESFEEVRDKAVEILDDERADSLPTRRALAEALAKAGALASIKTLARPAVRTVLRDAALFGTPWRPPQFDRLVACAGDASLRTDVPPLPRPPNRPLRSFETPLAITLTAGDAGARPVHDAAFLPNGRTLVAFGEAGVSLLSREGRLVTHFDVPAHHVVVSDVGDRAIAVARRGSTRRLSRLDLVTRRAADWCDAPVSAFASDYDGALWFAAGTDLFAIDAGGARFDGPWRVAEVASEGEQVLLARTPNRCFVYFEGESQIWNYELPSLVLRSRREVERHPSSPFVALSPDGGFAELANEGGLELRWSSPEGGPHTKALRGSAPVSVAASRRWIAAAAREEEGIAVFLVDGVGARVAAVIRLSRAESVALRFGPEVLTIGDDRGRLLVLDLDQGWLLRDLRV